MIKKRFPYCLTPSSDYLVNDDNIIDAAFKKAGYINSNGLTLYNLKKIYDNTLSSVFLPLKGNLLSCKVWKLLLKGFDDNKACLSYKMITILAKYIIDTNPLIKKSIDLTRDTAKALSVLKSLWNDIFSDYEDLGFNDMNTDNKDRHNKLLEYIIGYEDMRIKIDIIWDYLLSLEKLAKKSIEISDVLNRIATKAIA